MRVGGRSEPKVRDMTPMVPTPESALRRRVVAALDADASARTVADFAARLSAVLDGHLDGLHVGRAATAEHVRAMVGRAVPLRVVGGGVVPALLDASGRPDVLATVVGAHSGLGRTSGTGPVATALAAESLNPVVIVPSGGPGFGRSVRRLVIGLEGVPSPSPLPGLELLRRLPSTVEVIGVHVFTDATVPHFLDRPVRDLKILARELLLREHLALGVRALWRTGSAANGVVEAAVDEGADLIVLGWAQDVASDHSAVVRDTLRRTRLPVMLLPRRAPSVETARRREEVGGRI